MKQKFFDLARRLSFSSDHHQHKLGCVVVNKNRVVSFGFNLIKSHPKSTAAYSMLHAELSAIIGCSYKSLKGCSAYVYREDRLGKLAMSKPCPACHMALKVAGIKNVYYTVKGGWKEEQL